MQPAKLRNPSDAGTCRQTRAIIALPTTLCKTIDAAAAAMTLRTRPQWSRFKQSRNARRLSGALWQQRKRLIGPPRHGLLSVVVTDIQDYTRLTNEAPDEMGQVR